MYFRTSSQFSTTIKADATVGSSRSMSSQPLFEEIEWGILGATHGDFPCTAFAISDENIACLTIDTFETTVAFCSRKTLLSNVVRREGAEWIFSGIKMDTFVISGVDRGSIIFQFGSVVNVSKSRRSGLDGTISTLDQ